MTSDEQKATGSESAEFQGWKGKLRQFFKSKSLVTELRQKLRASIEAGRVSEDLDLAAAAPVIQNLVESPEYVIFALVKIGEQRGLAVRTVRELMWLLDRLEAEYQREQRG